MLWLAAMSDETPARRTLFTSPDGPPGSPVVRAARLDEVEQLLGLARMLHQESILSYLPFSDEKVRRLTIDYISQPRTHCVLVGENQGEVVGLFAGHMVDYFFNDELFALSTFVYVRPEKRGVISLRLIRGFEEWARERGAREIELDMSSGLAMERSAKLMERLGYRRVGYILKMKVN